MYSSPHMPSAPLAIENELAALLPTECIRRAAASDAVCGVQPRLVVEPANEQQLAAALRIANDANLAVIPRGGGTKLGWGHPPQRADLIVSTARLSRIIEHAWADLTVSVQAGCTIAALQSALAQHGQRLALDPLWPEQATIGGILATNDSGALRLRFGALRDLIIGITVALPDGTLASSGGKVVKNVAGYDLPKLMTGAFGTLGVITRAIFRLHPLPLHSQTLSAATPTFEAAQHLLVRVQDSTLAHTSLQARAADNVEPIVDILFDGTPEGIAGQVAQFRQLADQTPSSEADKDVWNARQQLADARDDCAIAKFSVLPAGIAKSLAAISTTAATHNLSWQCITQATGLGLFCLGGNATKIHSALAQLRAQFSRDSGSLILLRRPANLSAFDPWGDPGDSLTLMRALKSQFDPKHTLNPGRFLGGI